MKIMNHITTEDVLRDLEKIVEGHEAETYEGITGYDTCFYGKEVRDEFDYPMGIDGAAPLCLVGQVLAQRELLDRLDYRLNENRWTNLRTVYCPSGDDMQEPVASYFPEFTEEANLALQLAQDCQDLGNTWGEALAAARSVVSHV